MNWESTKHNLKWNTKAGQVARRIGDKIGLFLMAKGRSVLRWSMGRCSYCGRDCGMVSSVSRKGLRCGPELGDCEKRA